MKIKEYHRTKGWYQYFRSRGEDQVYYLICTFNSCGDVVWVTCVSSRFWKEQSENYKDYYALLILAPGAVFPSSCLVRKLVSNLINKLSNE